MSSLLHSLPSKDFNNTENYKIAIICARWNDHITYPLLNAAMATLKAQKLTQENIDVFHIPGSFELIYTTAQIAKSNKYDAVISIGCVIRGETPHFDYICMGVTQEIAKLNTTTDTPIVFGLITANTEQQALDRAGGSLGNKGSEFAQTAIEMCEFRKKIKKMS